MTDEITLIFLVFSEKLANECGYYAFLVLAFNEINWLLTAGYLASLQ
jgi:hypothetical protein